MSGYNELKNAIRRVVKTNNNREITGQNLQSTLTSMVNSLGANYHFAGFASPDTNPGTPDQNIFYIASEEGTYVNFDGINLEPGLSFLMWNGKWSSETISVGEVTKSWVQQNYVSIAFFNELFELYNDSTKIAVNDTMPVDKTKLNIKAMFGFWTEQYMSALGKNDSGGSGSGVDMATVWSALAGSTDEQINESHLTTALSEYATMSWVSQIFATITSIPTKLSQLANDTGFITSAALPTKLSQFTNDTDFITSAALPTKVSQLANDAGYVTASIVNGYATQLWVSQNYVSIEFFERLFQAYSGTTKVDTNSTSAIDNIKAMFGFWTEQYISALGQNDSGGSGSGGLMGSIVPYTKAITLTTQNEGSEIASAWSVKMLYDKIETIDVSGQLTSYLTKHEAQALYQPVGNYLTGITKAQVEGVLTGNITSHTHSQYLTSHQDISGKADRSELLGYLPLSGGTMTGNISVKDKYVFAGDPSGYDYGGLYRNHQISSGGEATTLWLFSYNAIKIDGSSVLINGYIPITSGNIGSQSVNYATSAGNADTVDNLHASNFGQIYIHNAEWASSGDIPSDLATGFHEIHISGEEYSSILSGKDFNGSYWQLYFHPTDSYTHEVFYRKPSIGLVRQFAFTDSNVASATKLQTTRTIWGQSFDGTDNIIGTFSCSCVHIGKTNEIWCDEDLYLNYGSSTKANVFICATGNVGIGTTAPTHKLHVNGDIATTGRAIVDSLQIGNITIIYDAANKGLRIAGGGLYTDSYLSSLGVDASTALSVKKWADSINLTEESDAELATAYSIGNLYRMINSNHESITQSLNQSVGALQGRCTSLEQRVSALENKVNK